ncbi:MAG: FkbM family methyltransferase [Planctomycetota bacterium]
MKLRELIYAFGLGRTPREYPFEVERFSLPREGTLEFARWRHPKERRKEISQTAVDALRTFLREGDCAIDVGAHTGDTTVPIALAVGRLGTVFAFEPNPYVFKILEANASLNREKTSIVPLPFAATEDDGEFAFTYSDPGFSSGGLPVPGRRRFFRLQVAGKNIVRFLQRESPDLLERVRYVKIDTDGHDRSVVASMRDFLLEKRPYLKTEFYKHLTVEARIAQYDELRALGYRLHRCLGEETYRGPEVSIDDLKGRSNFDAFAVPEDRA